ncbi:MAG TPA: hypothetical protein VMG12_22320, partial [Polyangiaceae bacterium]|nr:hypothetical protein [Polyangiaceae bacterium]
MNEQAPSLTGVLDGSAPVDPASVSGAVSGSPVSGSSVSGSPTTARLSARVKWAFATGGAADILGHWLYFNLADPVYSSYFHLSPTQI